MAIEVELQVGSEACVAQLGTKWGSLLGLVRFHTLVSKTPRSVAPWDGLLWAIGFSSQCPLSLPLVLANCRHAALLGLEQWLGLTGFGGYSLQVRCVQPGLMGRPTMPSKFVYNQPESLARQCLSACTVDSKGWPIVGVPLGVCSNALWRPHFRIGLCRVMNAFAVGWARWRTEAQAWLSAARSAVVAVYPGSVVNSGTCEVLTLAMTDSDLEG